MTDSPLVTDTLVDRCAMTAYEAVMVDAGPHREPLATAPEQQKRTLRLIARAVLEEALRPDPDQPVLDGQDPLI